MDVVPHIPDDFAERLSADGDVEREALEALALESFRAGWLTRPELHRLLGFGSRPALDAFLVSHEVFGAYSNRICRATSFRNRCGSREQTTFTIFK